MTPFSDAQHFYDSALNYFNEQKYQEAEKEIKQALSIDSTSKDFNILYAQILTSLRNWEEAEIKLIAAKIPESDLVNFYNSWGNDLFTVNKDYAGAEVKYRKAIEYNPDSFINYRNLGLALSQQKKSEEAMNAFKKSIEISEKLNEKYGDAYESLSIELGKNGKWDEAEQQILGSNAPNKNISSFYNTWGNDLFNVSKDYVAAGVKYGKAIEYNPDSFIDYRNLGLALSQQKKPAEAMDAFKKAIEISEKLNEKYGDAYESLSIELGKNGKWEEAEQRILGSNPLNKSLASFYNSWGNDLFNVSKDYVAAEVKYGKAIEYNPYSFINYRNLGLALSQQKKSEEAMDAFKKSIEISEKLNEKYGDAYESLSIELGKNGKWQEAEQQILGSNPLNKSLSSFYNTWGNDLFTVNKDYAGAEVKYRKAIEYNPDSFIDYRNLGLALSQQKKPADAIENFRLAADIYRKVVKSSNTKLDNQDEYLDALNDWGLILLEQNKLDEAKQKFEECILANPKYVFAYENLGFIAHKEKKYDEAITYLNQSLQITPNSTWALFKKGLIYGEKKQYENAIANYEKVLEIDDSDAFAQHNIANIYWSLGLYDKGREKWGDTVRLYKKWVFQKRNIEADQNFYFYYGGILNENFGLTEAAKSIYKIGLEADRENYNILIALGNLCKKMSEEDEGNKAELLWQSREYFIRARTVIEKKILKEENTEVSLLRDLTQLLLDTNDFRFATIFLYNEKDKTLPLKKKFPELLALLEEKDPDSASIKALIGVYYSRIEDYKKATEYFKQSLNYNEDDFSIWSNLAETYLNQDLFENAYKEYSKILRKVPCHIESLIGLGECCIRFGEKGDSDFYELAIKHFNKALDLSRTGEGSKFLHNKEKAAVLYSRGFSLIQIYEGTKNNSNILLQKALFDFKESYNLDKDKYKSKIAYDKVKQRLSLLSTHRITEKFGPGFIFLLSLFVFICIQILFLKSFFFKERIIDLGSYSLFTFGTLVFMIAALYLPNVLKLKVAGIELEKSSIDLISISGNLGISRDTGSSSSISS